MTDLRPLRLARGWSQATLARFCGLTAATVSRAENKPRTVRKQHREAMLRALQDLNLNPQQNSPHRWNSETAAGAGRIGGKVVSQDREHMRRLGKAKRKKTNDG